MDIEELAVAAVKKSISRTEHLKPLINTGDKEASWDGNIYIHTEGSQSKNGITRIPVQVKGRDCSDKNITIIDEDTVSYPVLTIDLSNYYKDGGTIYFLVVIQENPYRESIYYANLLPWDIYEYLKKANTQKSIHVTFRIFPSEKPEEIENIVIRANRDKQKQASIINLTNEDLENYKHGNYKRQFEVSMSPNSSFLQAFNTQLPYIYAEVTSGIKIPISKAVKIQAWAHEIPCNVSVNNKTFYNTYKRNEDVLGDITLIFGEYVYLAMKHPLKGNKTSPGTLTCEMKGTLDQQIKNYSFFYEVIKNNVYEIDGKKYSCHLSDDQDLLNNTESRINFLVRFRCALNNAGYSDDIPIEDFDDKTWKLVDDFCTVFYDKKEINFKSLTVGKYYCCITFGKTVIPIFVSKDNTICEIQNPYIQLPLLCTLIETNEKYPISPYVIFNDHLLSSVTYLDFDSIYKGLLNVEMSDVYHGYITNLILRVLNASDSDAPLKNKYLDFAMNVTRWLYEKSKDMDINTKEITLLNLMQIKKRLQPLETNDINRLHALLEDHPQMCIQNKIGLYILTGQLDCAYYLWGQLPENDQKAFLRYPIMHFWDFEKYPLPQVSSQEDNHAGETTEGTD